MEVSVEIVYVLAASRPIFLHKAYSNVVDCDGNPSTRRPETTILVILLLFFYQIPSLIYHMNENTLKYFSNTYFYSSLCSSLPLWLPPAMLEIHILALYLGNQELCSENCVKMNSVE